MAKSPRMQLPFLSAGQAQKEITHNEALVVIDAMLHACTGSAPSNNPPASPEPGSCYICGASPTGAWIGHGSSVAIWTAGGWRFVDAFEGLQIMDRASGRMWRYEGGQWFLGVLKGAEVQLNGIKVVGSQQPAIAAASGGTTIDSQARATLALVLAALRTHGLIATQAMLESHTDRISERW